MMRCVQIRAVAFQQSAIAPTKMVCPKPAPKLAVKAPRPSASIKKSSRALHVHVHSMHSDESVPLVPKASAKLAKVATKSEANNPPTLPADFGAQLQACRDMLYAMSIKEYVYEDPSKDLEKLIVLIQNDETPFILDDILDVVRNAVSCATLSFRKVTTAIRAAEVLSLLSEPPNEEQAAKLRASVNHVSNAIDATFQLDRKAVNHFEMVAFFVAAERACPTVGKTLIRRRGIAFAGRFKELVSYVGRRGMTPKQATVLFCPLNKLASDGRLHTSNRDMTFLAAKIEDGCSKLSSSELEAVAHHARHTSSLQVTSMLHGIAMEATHRAANNPASNKNYAVILKTVLRSVDITSGRPAAVELKKKIKQWAVEQEAAVQAANEGLIKEMAYSFAACTVLTFLSAAKDYPPI